MKVLLNYLKILMEQISETSAPKQVRPIVPHMTVMWPNPQGMYAIRAERDYVINEDFMKAVRKVSDTKKLETKLDYKQV